MNCPGNKCTDMKTYYICLSKGKEEMLIHGKGHVIWAMVTWKLRTELWKESEKELTWEETDEDDKKTNFTGI